MRVSQMTTLKSIVDLFVRGLLLVCYSVSNKQQEVGKYTMVVWSHSRFASSNHLWLLVGMCVRGECPCPWCGDIVSVTVRRILVWTPIVNISIYLYAYENYIRNVHCAGSCWPHMMWWLCHDAVSLATSACHFSHWIHKCLDIAQNLQSIWVWASIFSFFVYYATSFFFAISIYSHFQW